MQPQEGNEVVPHAPPSSEPPESQASENLGDLSSHSLSRRTLDDLLAGSPEKIEIKNDEDLEGNEADRVQGEKLLLQLRETTGKAENLVRETPGIIPGDKLDISECRNAIQNSVDSLIAVVQLGSALNQLGDPKNPRVQAAGEELLYPAAQYINTRVKTEAIPAPLPAEKRLVTCLVKSKSKNAKPAGWQRIGNAAFEMIEKCDTLPGPQVYLAASKSTAESTATLRAKYESLEREISEARRVKEDNSGKRRGGDLDRVQELSEEKSDIEEALDKALEKVTDVDPYLLPEVVNSVKVRTILKMGTVSQLLKVHQSLGALIEKVLLPPSEKEETAASPSQPLACAELVEVKKTSSSGSAVRLSVAEIEAAALLNEGKNSEMVAFLLSQYHRTRLALQQIFPEIDRPPAQPNTEHKNFLNDVAGAIGPLFGSSERTRKILGAVGQIEDPKVREIHASLLACPTYNRRDNSFSLTLDRPEDFPLLAQTIGLFISGSSASSAAFEKAMAFGPLKRVVDICSQIRELMQKESYIKLARFLDEEINRVIADSSAGFTDRAALLCALYSVAEHPAARKAVKGHLNNLKKIETLTSQLLKPLSADRSEAPASIEKMRARISRRFLSDLGDYWGQRKLIAEIRRIFSNNLKLLEKPESWRGLEPHKVIYNGILFHGDPGAGKTYLVTCASNDYEIPLVTITREEMAEAFERAAQAAAQAEARGKSGSSTPTGEKPKGSELETSLASFMDGKLAQAKKEKEKSGARACILFIDEMEAEFLDRDPRTSARSELVRTNIMLRVIERLITEHSDIFFFGATNHIDQVDSAALRKGRFGFHFEVKLPEKEDVEEILTGSFNKLEIDLSTDVRELSEYKQLVEKAVGMTPYAITLAINHTIALERATRDAHDIGLEADLLKKLQESMVIMRDSDHRQRTKDNADRDSDSK